MKENNMTMTPSQKADRLAMIREAAAKMNQKVRRNASVKRTETSFMDKKLPSQSFMDKATNQENINQWTDASKYAQEYYGETLHYTTKFDNDWD